MKRFCLSSLIASLFVLVGCAATPPAPAPAYVELGYSKAPLPRDVRVMLVAGSSDTANFAQEIVSQRRLWMSRGVPASQIACYYSAPGENGWQNDHAQFASLAPELEDCYPADVVTIEKHLAAAARRKPPTFYLYFSGHGTAPARVVRECLGAVDGQEAIGTSLDWHVRMEQNHASASQYGLITDAEPGRRPREYRRWVDRVESGTDIADTILTPTRFAAMLKKFPERTRKIVVLQGCFAGGFLAPWISAGKRSSLLAEVANVQVLTASASNRMSFGCDAGSQMTYYGKAFFETLAETPGTPPEIAWAKVHERVSEKVRWEERMLRFYPEFYSDPLYRANQVAE